MTNRIMLSELYDRLEALLSLQATVEIDGDRYNSLLYDIRNTVEEIEQVESDIEEQSV